MKSEWMDYAELAAYFGWARATVRKKRCLGELPPSVGWGKARRWKRSVVERWWVEYMRDSERRAA